jgi:soluble lytic murein transglycosylase-like protein
MSVEAHRAEGDSVVLTLRSGGEIVCEAALIAAIRDDEVPYPEPSATRAEPLDPPSGPSDPAASGQSTLLEAVPYADIIDSIATAQGVDPTLVRALIHVESGYRPRARSPRGAMGLMQLMPDTARQYAVKNPYDPRANIEGGIKHLKALLSRFDVRLALAAYNAGEAAVQKFNGIPPYRETRQYVSRIMAMMRPAATY